MIRLAYLLFAAALAMPLHAEIPVKIYAQQLVDETVAKNPDLLVVVMHVTPPKAADNVIIASNIGRIGKLGDEDDMRVINTGKSNLEVAHGGDRFEVELVLRDMDDNTIGAIGLVWPYQAGQDKKALEQKTEMIRDALAKRILNAGNLMDRFPFDSSATTKTHAQKLVEQTVAKYPELSLLALRAASKGGGDIVTLGSNFGRHGKKADAEDKNILDSGVAKTHILPGGKRFSGSLPLRDSAGKAIGILNVGYAVKQGDDEKALLAKAEKLRDELQKAIPSAEKLAELDP